MNKLISSLAETTPLPADLVRVAIGEARAQMLRIDTLAANGRLQVDEAASIRQELRKLQDKLREKLSALANDSPMPGLDSLLDAAKSSTGSPLFHDSLGEIRDAVSIADRPNLGSRTLPLLCAAFALACAGGFLYAIDWAAATLRILDLGKDSPYSPLIKGVLLLFQAGVVVCVAAFGYFTVQAFVPGTDHRILGSLIDKTRAFWGATGSSDKVSQPIAALLSLKGLAALAAASGVVVTAVGTNNQDLPAPIQHPVSQERDMTKWASFGTEIDRFQRANGELDAHTKTLGGELVRMKPLVDKLAGTGSPVVHLAVPDKITLALDSQSQHVAKDAIDAKISAIRTNFEMLNQAVIKTDQNVTELRQKGEKLTTQNQTLNNNLWRLCFAVHRNFDTLSSLRNGVVTFGSGFNPDWEKIGLDCNHEIRLSDSISNDSKPK